MSARSALIVDDSKSARFALRRHLESHAYKVDAVESAQEAYRVLRELRPDLIFMDHVMPGEDGFEALRHLKADPHTAAIPVVICSGNEGDHFVDEARSQGAADVLAKPPSPDQLLQVLENVQREREQNAAARAVVDVEAAAPTARADREAARSTAAVEVAPLPLAARSETREALAGERAAIEAQFGALRTTLAQLDARLGNPPVGVVALEARLQQTEQQLSQRLDQIEGTLAAVQQQFAQELERHTQQTADRIAEALLKALGRS
ncbi:MAG TPA: response regulator [Solimonas sp.]